MSELIGGWVAGLTATLIREGVNKHRAREIAQGYWEAYCKDDLEAEIEQLRYDHETEVERLNGMREEVLHYQREFHRLRADAERYRWLLDRYTILLLNGESELRITNGPRANSKSGIDTAIDAARGEPL